MSCRSIFVISRPLSSRSHFPMTSNPSASRSKFDRGAKAWHPTGRLSSGTQNRLNRRDAGRRMFKRRENNGEARVETLIGKSASVQGDVEFAGGLHVDGRITGNV